MTILSNTDALLLAVPMIGLLVICHFRLDELVGKPRRRAKTSHLGRVFAGTESETEPGTEAGNGAEDGREQSPKLGRDVERSARRVLPAARRPRVRAEME